MAHDPFRHMESLMRDWLQAARLRDIARVLALIGEELARRA
jgi:hypothetical protein